MPISTAARSAESIRAKFRSEEFKAGLFGDTQQIFERALSLSMEAGDVEAGWRLSEASRSRALLDVVRERVSLGGATDAVALSADPVPLREVQATLRGGEALVEFHTLDQRLYAWVVRKDSVKGVTIEQPRAGLEKIVDQFRQSIFERKRTRRGTRPAPVSDPDSAARAGRERAPADRAPRRPALPAVPGIARRQFATSSNAMRWRWRRRRAWRSSW
ncbi:MAG: hypothetical protein MZV65_48275 [Chromatiales bacterium]|nr:hypothetical protein [Chromatiales bacterium]